MKDSMKELYDLIENMPITEKNKNVIDEIKIAIKEENLQLALEKLETLSKENSDEKEEIEQESDNEINFEDIDLENIEVKVKTEEKYKKEIYPKELSNDELEYIYIGLLLNNPELIVKFYILYDDCFFENTMLLNLYKRILFTDGEPYASEISKRGFNFFKNSEEAEQEEKLARNRVEKKNYNIEDVYIELRKLFVLRKNYRKVPIKYIQDNIIEIVNFKLYHQMSIEEVENAVEQVTVTSKFKKAILTQDLTKFLEMGDNNLTNGLKLQFPILSSVFKGIRRGETMSFAMPSNAGKSRFTVNLAAYTSFIHKKKVLIISNEMSEEKMRLCLITTILNNPEIQKIHKNVITKTEGELLDFKFRPNNPKEVKVDKDGFIIKEPKETRKNFIKRLSQISTEFNNTIAATDWVNKQINNSIYFINITDHTNDELQKVIMHYYYKEKIEYIFYDTLKTDTDNIGNGEELKKTATILSNLAQNFNMFICSTLQLTESSTSPINLNVNDLAVSRTVKEVLDTLCLIKQINSQAYKDYEYSLKEVDTKFYNIEKCENPDVRYYACVVDKNRAGAKPKLLFKLNLAYNIWEELGYLKLKQDI